MKRWEYKVEKFETKGLLGGNLDVEDVEDRLNQLGKSGWELIVGHSTTQDLGASRKVIYTFKKEINS